MLAVAVELLAGRYTATSFNDRSRAEWPPHPARLFSALVARWADAARPDAAERESLLWLERQPPPAITCSTGAAVRWREPVIHYVPVNDSRSVSRDISGRYAKLVEALAAQRSRNGKEAAKAERDLERVLAKVRADSQAVSHPTGRESEKEAARAAEVLPELRTRQARTFPTVVPDDPAVWFIWEQAQPSSEVRAALDGLLARVGRLGHSSTLVACRIDDDPPAPTLIVGDGTAADAAVLRVPREGLLERLEMAYETHRGEEPRALPAVAVPYVPVGRPRRRTPRPTLAGDWYVLPIPRGARVRLSRTLDLTRAVRGAVMRHGEQPSPEILCGHRPSGDGQRTAPSDRPHVAYVPLANVGHRHGDGVVSAVALVLPTDAGPDDRSVVESALASWRAAGFELTLPGGMRLVLDPPVVDRDTRATSEWLDTSPRLATSTRSYWCRPARRWLSVTPVALDRFPKSLGSRDPARRSQGEQQAIETIARACTYVGLPEPVSVTIHTSSPLAGVPVVGRGPQARQPSFIPYRAGGSGQARACVHAEIEFADAVAGPVLVGAGRYLGYGLFLPADDRWGR
ncbi:MAG: type I-U CRISPR-associated protein Csb2 [Acidimicrobiia bacterium]